MGVLFGGTLQAAGPVPEGAQGTVTGKISFTGTVPPAEKRKLIEDPVCAAMHKDGLELQSVRVKDDGVAEVLVYVKTGLTGKYAPPAEPVLIDQRGCQWFPRMVAVMAGQPLRIRNSDHTSHNVHPLPRINKEFNIMQPRKGMESTKTFDKPELMIPLGCAAHPWMVAYMLPRENKYYAVTADDGTFEIANVPAGEPIEIQVWHEHSANPSGLVVTTPEAKALNWTSKGRFTVTIPEGQTLDLGEIKVPAGAFKG
jgi:hypothetical protein